MRSTLENKMLAIDCWREYHRNLENHCDRQIFDLEYIKANTEKITLERPVDNARG